MKKISKIQSSHYRNVPWELVVGTLGSVKQTLGTSDISHRLKMKCPSIDIFRDPF